MTALSRQGFIFTQQEKDLVRELEETGRHMEAQAIIIEAMEGAFKGAAGAVAEVTSATDRYNRAVEELKAARGRDSESIVNWWLNILAANKEAKTEIIDTRTEAKKAEEAIKRLPAAMSEMSILQRRLQTSPGDMALTRQVMSLQREIEELTSTKHQNALMVLRQRLQEAKDEIANRGGHIHTQRIPELEALINALQQQIAEEERLAEVERRVEQERQRAATSRAEDQRKIDADDQTIIKNKEKISEIESAAAGKIETINKLRILGFYGAEEAAIQINAAYRNEVETLLNLEQEQKELFLNDKTRLAEITALRQAALDAAIQGYNQTAVDAKETVDVEKERNKIISDFTELEKALRKLKDEDAINDEEFNSRYIQGKKQQYNALMDLVLLAERQGLENGNVIEDLAGVTAEIKTFEEYSKSLAGDKSLEERWKGWKSALDEVGLSSEKLRELEIKRVRDEINSSNASEGAKKEALEWYNKLIAAQEAYSLIEETDELKRSTEEWVDALAMVGKTSKEVREAETKRVIEAIRAMKAEPEVIQAAIEAYEALRKAEDEFAKESARTAQNDEYESRMKGWKSALDEVGLSSEKLRELEIKRVRDEIENAKLSDDVKKSALKLYNELIAAQDKYRAKMDDKALMDRAQEWKTELDKLTLSSSELRNAEIARVRDEINSSNASEGAKASALESYNALVAAQDKYLDDERLKEHGKALADINERLADMTMTESGRIEAQRRKELENLKTLNLSKEEYKELAAKTNEYYNLLQKDVKMKAMTNIAKDGISTITQISEMILSNSASLVSQEYDLIRESLDKEYELYRAAADKKYELLYAELEKEKQLRLFNAGAVKAENEAQAIAELQLAEATMNLTLIDEAKKNLERIRIEEEFAAEEKALKEQQKAEELALEEEYEKKRADLEYQAQMIQWKYQLASAAASVAQAVIMAAINTWPLPAVPMVAAATALGAVQMGTLMTNRPKPPAFAHGGVVPGNSYSGDNMLIRANSAERVLTDSQNESFERFVNLLNKLNNGGNQDETGTGMPVEINIYLSEHLIAKSTVDLINNRRYLIHARSVVK
jgi:hypothetical protein